MIHFSNEVWGSMGTLGLFLIGLWVGINLMGEILAAGINYVNENNKATSFCTWWKWKWLHIHGQGDRACATITFTMLAGVLPYIILGLISIYPVPLFLLTTYGVLRIARGAKRISRKLTSHTVDPEAHKNA